MNIPTLTIPEVVAKVLDSSRYWAPEIAPSKLCDYLEAYGEPLLAALSALPMEQQQACGLDRVHRTGGRS